MKLDDVEIPDTSTLILDTLKEEKYPIPRGELLEKLEKESNLELTRNELSDAIDILRKRGYDVKKVDGRKKKKLYVLVRQAESSKDNLYRPLAKIETPLALAGDFHIGHEAFSEQAFNYLIEMVEKYSLKDIMMPGDILQGLGVHSQEAKDIKEPDIDSQVEMAKNYLEKFPDDCTLHVTIGNHEQKLKGKHKVGYDAVKHLCTIVDNAVYYGSVAEFTLNNEFRYLMMHGGGGQSYARSYKLQGIWRSLPSPRPDIVHVGHYHILQPVPMTPNKLLVCSGTFQRESSYIIWKGKKTQVGFYILHDYDENRHHLDGHIPSVY